MASTIILSDNGVSSGSAGLKETGGNDGVLILQTTTSGGTATNAVYINNTQKVGVGTASPSTNLTIGNGGGGSDLGVALSRGATTNFFEAYDGTKTMIAGTDASNAYVKLGSLSAHPVAIVQGNTNAIYIDTSNNVGIGTSSPKSTLNVAGNVTTNGGGLLQNLYYSGGFKYSSSSAILGFVVSSDSTGMYFSTAPASGTVDGAATVTERMRVDSSGNFILASTGIFYSVGVYNSTTANAANMYVSSGGSFNRSTSALKYKQDVRDLESIDITKFRAVRYKSKCENDDQTKDHFGFIADEVLEAGIPELVNYGDNGEVEGFQYERMTAVLLKAIQEQQALITTLTERITALEAK